MVIETQYPKASHIKYVWLKLFLQIHWQMHPEQFGPNCWKNECFIINGNRTHCKHIITGIALVISNSATKKANRKFALIKQIPIQNEYKRRVGKRNTKWSSIVTLIIISSASLSNQLWNGCNLKNRFARQLSRSCSIFYTQAFVLEWNWDSMRDKITYANK